ncbi:MAG: hypothetical protein HQK53_15770, partial [Oligoflexia bacterium]|nr:hypothetical protein [Oligoflexia bacterium]
MNDILVKYNNLSISYKLTINTILAASLICLLSIICYLKLSDQKKLIRNISISYQQRDSIASMRNTLVNIHGDIYKTLSWVAAGYDGVKIKGVLTYDLQKVSEIKEEIKNFKDVDPTVIDNLLISLQKYKKWIEDILEMMFVDSLTANMLVSSIDAEFSIIFEG